MGAGSFLPSVGFRMAASCPPIVAAPKLGLADAVSLVVGIIIGVGIFETPAWVFSQVPGPWAAMAVWAGGGLFALIGALCFAELSSTYPHSGGEYVYVSRAFGSLVGYLYAWAQVTVIRPGSIAAVAYCLAFYAGKLVPLQEQELFLVAGASVVVLTLTNIVGVTLSTTMQNLLTLAKVLGLSALIGVGLAFGCVSGEGVPAASPPTLAWLPAAMIPVLWTYAGWQEAGYVASEVKNSRRNLPLALILGTAVVTLLYLAVNLAYLGLGYEQAKSKTVAADVLALAWPDWAPSAMAGLIVVSALGAINGMIFTTARIYAVFGADHRLFHPLGAWSAHTGTPMRALLMQGALALAFIAGVWSIEGDSDSFTAALNLTAGVFWLFFLLTGLALFTLRQRDPDVERPYRVPGYPFLPIVFLLGCLGMLIGSVLASWHSLLGLAILAAGFPFYRPVRPAKPSPALEPVLH